MKSTSNILVVLALLVVLGVGVFAITGGDDSSDSDGTATTNSQTTEREVAGESNINLPFDLSLTNLATLDAGVYEGWVVRGDDKTSFGTFNMNAAGEIIGDLSYDGDLQAGDTVAISIEPDNDADPEPSATIILAGEVTDGAAELAFPLDISSFAGEYILGTPTTNATDDETAGIWFTSSGTNTLLDIPDAPDGWIYEGWAVVDGVPYTTGQFTDPSGADNFDGYSGPDGGPAKPGEDFITNLPGGVEGPLDLATGTSKVVVSIEPYQNGSDPTGAGPAQIKPLSHDIGEGVADHTRFSLDLNTDLPTGSVSVN
ncbi:MAG: anti-sigma factor [Patescibacteria group bacterium]